MPIVRVDKIVKVRNVRIGSAVGEKDFVLVLAETNQGQKIVLLQYEKQLGKWWNRMYDVGKI